jgi:hypothetical protein
MKKSFVFTIAALMFANSVGFAAETDVNEEALKNLGLAKICKANYNREMVTGYKNCSDLSLSQAYVEADLLEKVVVKAQQDVAAKKNLKNKLGLTYNGVDNLELTGLGIVITGTGAGLVTVAQLAFSSAPNVTGSAFLKASAGATLIGIFGGVFLLKFADDAKKTEVKWADVPALESYLTAAQRQLQARKMVINAILQSRDAK